MNQNQNKLQIAIQPNLSLLQMFKHIFAHELCKQIPAQIHQQFGYAQKLKNPKNNITQTFKIQKIMNLADVYICYDCQVNCQGWMCQKCFIQAGHQRYCRVVVKELEEQFWNVYRCACGDYDKVSFKGTCSQHHKISINAPVCHLPKQEILTINSYITGCFKMLIVCLQTLNLQSKFDKSQQLNDLQSFLYWTYQRRLFQDLSTSTKKTNQYTSLLQQCLLQPLPQDYFSTPTPNPTILTYLLSKILKLEDRSFTTLLQLLLEYNSKKFMYVLVEDCLLAKGMIRNRKMALLKELKNKNVFRGDFLCEIVLEVWGRHGDGVFDVEDLWFYSSATCPNLYLHKQQRKQSYLLPYWQHLHTQNNLTIQKILQTHTTSILSVLTNTLPSPKLFSQMLIKLIKYTNQKITSKFITKNETGRNINIIQMCNLISKLTLAYVQGDYHQIYTFIDTLAVDKELCFILYYYFGDIVGNISHISQQAVFTFGVFLGCLQARKPECYEEYVKMWEGKKIESEKMIDLMAKISNIIFGQQLKYLAKITNYKPITQQQRSCIQKKQQKKLIELLYMQKKLPKKQLQVILKQNILNFPKASQIMQTYTQYDDKSDCFIYNSTEDHSSFDGIFNAIFDLWGTQVDNLVFDNQDDEDGRINQDNYQVRKLVISGIMKPFLEGDERDIYLVPPSQVKNSYKIVKSEFEYAKFICLITIDKYVDGKIVSLRNYLLSKRKQLCKQPILQNPENKAQKMINKLQKIFGCLNPNMRQQEIVKIVENTKITQIQNQTLQESKEQNKMMDTNENGQSRQQQQQQLITLESKIKTEQTKTQPVPFESPSSQKSIPQSIQSTPNSKLQKLRQKFKKKQESVLNIHIDSNNFSPSKQNAQTCMTCKQQGYHDNALFYLGTLKKQGQQCKIFQSAFRTDYSATLCMHLVHQKCFLKMCTGSSVACPLCRTNSNIIFPHQNQHLTPKTLQFFQNRLTYTLISSFQEYHHDKSFIFMLKTVISQALFEIISSILLLRDDAQQGIIKNISTQQNNKKIKYYLSLIRKWWDGLDECQRDVELLKINRQFRDSCKGVGMMGQKNPKIIMDLIVKNVIWNQIDKYDISKQLHHLLSQLQELMDAQQFIHFLKKIQQITPNPIKFAPAIQRKGSKKFLDHYMTPPQKLCCLQLNKTCPKCVKQTPTFYCLLCNIIYCNGCNHEKTHDNIYLRIECASGQIQSKGKTVSSNTKVYFNGFHQAWKSVQYGHDDYFAYTIDNLAVGKAVTVWIRNISI